MLRGEAMPIIGLIDGVRNIQDIQLELIRLCGGAFVGIQEVEEMISQLDRALLLDSKGYRKEKNKLTDDYAKLSIREAVLAGNAYPDDPAQLNSYIRSVLEKEENPPENLAGKKMFAVVAPHIDLEVGKNIYARAYRILEGSSPKKILLLGTGHHLADSLVSLTEKDFRTPLGRVGTDRAWVERVKKNCPPGFISSSDIDHRNEHSLEFQILFLQYLFGSDFRLLPILCGSFHQAMPRYSRAAEIPGMSDFVSVLRLFLESDDTPALVVAGVDFSHIGPKFGHREPATSLLLEAKQHDRSLLKALSRGDGACFWSEVKEQDNRFNVCGFSTLALLLELLARKTGHVLGYDFWMEEATQSAVSYAALAFPLE
jgi:hypothetical protein